ncbi:transcriptional regulator [Novosphingobium panipatense]|uniref:transcriptional regulator n=1 Tax=Novosphingobium panipatense TaxID=428991 RepID=UPI0039A3180D
MKKANLIVRTTAVLRERIFAVAEGERIGSLHELARSLEVGIVTLQQVARVLEHEGLLEVRRGPGGGYYGARPDAASLERGLHAYMRMNPASYEEALDVTSLLFNELATAAARCTEPRLRAQLSVLAERLPECSTMSDCGRFEVEFQELLFRMVRRPLFEMLTRVTLQYSTGHAAPQISVFDEDGPSWRDGRKRIIAAILANDAELTRFEANRQNRAVIIAYLNGRGSGAGGIG